MTWRMPAEWEPHEATWLAWPHERTDWPGKFAPIPWVYGDIVRHLARVERVRILVEDADARKKRAARSDESARVDMSAVEFFRWPTNRSWTRDYCPIFVRNQKGEIAITQLALQRLGEVRQLARRQSHPSRVAKR